MRDQRTIGNIVGTFGLKGFIKVLPLTDFPEQRFAPGSAVYVDGIRHEILELQWHKQQARLRLEGVKRLEVAQALIGKELTVPADDLPELEEGEYLVEDLIGLEVYDTSGARLGTLDEVIQAPAHDLYRIGAAQVPAVSEFVKEIDLANRKITIEPIPGMFDDAD